MFSWKKPVRTACCIVVAWLLAAGWAMAALSEMEDPKKVSWHISALMVTYDNERQVYIAEDNVVITGGQTRLEADYAEFNNQTKDAFAQGSVLFISGGDTITCDAMNINLLTETGTISRGTIFIQEGNYYISGDALKKTGKFTYDAQKGQITTCSGEAPDWKMTAKNIKVTIEGYGRAQGAALWAKKVPVLYSPYLVFPVKNKRQTGLLFPAFGSSVRRGVEYEQPLFLALSRNADATVYAHYMSDRGLKTAGELRYVLSPSSKGMIVADYLNDSKIGDGTDENTDYNYSSTPPRTNHDRYWIRMKHDQDLGSGFTAKIDIDYVSDPDYLLEFRDGFSGYDVTDQNFKTMFGRNLDEYDETLRTNRLQVYKAWSHYNLNIKTLWYDNIEDRVDTTLQTLPGIEFDAARQQIFNSGVYYTLDSEFRSFYRQETTDTRVNGRRADVHPQIYYPMNLGPSFFFEPYAGLRGTVWHTNDFTDSTGDDSDFRTRGLYEAGAQLSTSLSRVFNLDSDFADKIKHEITPKLEYDYIPYENQDDLPYFDDLDDIDEKNLVTWSVTNTITSRTLTPKPDGSSEKQYRELAWFKLFQSYSIRDERDDKDAELRPWQALRLKYELNPFTNLSSNGEFAFNVYNQHVTLAKVGATLKDNRGDSFHTAYTYTTKDPYLDGSDLTYTHSLLARLNLHIFDYLSTYYSLEKDIDAKRTIEVKAGFKIDKECWGLIVEFKDESADKSFAFMVTLKGIGDFGSI